MFFALLSLIALCRPGFTDGSTDWVETTDRSDDPEIIRLMDESNFSRKIELAKALGERRDPYAADIIVHYLSLYRHNRRYEQDLVLSSILSAVFPPKSEEARRTARIEANREAIADLIGECDGFESDALKAACIRLGVDAGIAGIGPLAAREGGRLALSLRKNRGLADRAQTEEILAILEAIGRLGVKNFGGLPADFARFSGDRRIVERARAVTSTLE
ncbi:MAG: hypothetical protein JXD23_11610 [Spirochaetales bacterium]|nr:hypothetical protein [Spirochaetales bacterium]